MADISSQINTIEHDKNGANIKRAIWEALYILQQAGPSHVRGYIMDICSDVAWGVVGVVAMGIAEEVDT